MKQTIQTPSSVIRGYAIGSVRNSTFYRLGASFDFIASLNEAMLPAVAAARAGPVFVLAPLGTRVRVLLAIAGGRRLLVVDGVAESEAEDALWVGFLSS